MRTNLTILMAIAAIGLMVFAFYQVAKPAGIVGSYEVAEYDLSTLDGTTVRGYWIINLSVDQRDEIAFIIEDENVPIEADESKGIPPGSEIIMGSTVSVILRPAGPPYVSGPVRRVGFCYNDQYIAGTDRVWSFYTLADPMWHVDGLHAPYEVEVQEDGQVIFPPTVYVAGIREGWDTGQIIQLTPDIQLRQFAQLTNGLVIPAPKWAYWWYEPGNPWEDDPTGPVEIRLAERDIFQTQIQADWGKLNDRWAESSDKWCEVGAILNLQNIPNYYQLYGDTLFGERQGVPTNVVPFASDSESLYNETVPDDTDSWAGNMPAFSWKSQSTNYTAIWNLPAASVTAVVQVKADASVFDSWIYKPPYGKPEITNVVAPDWSAGSYGTVQVQVKNTGITEDTFIGELSLPSTIAIIEGPGRVSIPVNTTRTLTWKLTASASDIDQDMAGTVKVIAINSAFEDSASVNFKLWAGNGTPPQGVGSVRGIVQDKDGPTKGAIVSCGAGWTYTSDDGSFLITNIRQGSYTLKIDKAGYAPYQQSVSILKDQVTDVGIIFLRGSILWWEEYLLVIVVVAIAGVVAIVGIALWRRSKR